ncbi:unnamed protein product [Owenia fusiformis]|uniref:Extracellular globin n=1 Tax=Owenia fusiformis TaxID=6347 RepID=A0A8J1U1A3_OWEFU|nr:unnamed protein product [Owenia fusiformis]
MVKLFIAFAFMAIVAVGYSKECCSAEDKQSVSSQWHDLWTATNGGGRVKIATDVFTRFFAKNPEARALFKNVRGDDFNHPEWVAHTVRIMNGFDLCINNLEDTKLFNQVVGHLSSQHVARIADGFDPNYFDLFKEPLGETLESVISGFNAIAWDNCYNRISEGLKSNF